ncbi:UDP-N-acetyl-D-mannosamine dehydrogenase [Actinopolymorpha rutila]|uniref:UDP-N-acetyl-D-mannosaminuronic acid dehydrogenase n=1 Tax=Actinopolymorpha rutila TaxID=446787 RepID=A0A852Z7C8_9ACTN|nr:UDP-N-acetyl-D-mannosaminuronic acid dehydrogenase [Actinopolymorpha rutila]
MTRVVGRVAVVGLGYIGLPTAAALATQGVEVRGVDVNTDTVRAVNRGEVPFVEPDLAVAVSGAVSMDRLRASTRMPEAAAYIIAVPTPFKHDRRPDLSYVRAAAEEIAPRLRPGALVILESTSPPGTTLQVSEWLAELRPDLVLAHQRAAGPVDVHVAYCPERVLPGRIMIEIVTNDRVIGGITPACAQRAAEVYRTFAQGELHLTDAGTAELTKLAENAYRDVNIAFANELAQVAERLGVEVWDVIELANRHPRVQILRPGPGVGGHCVAVDPWFLVSAAPEDTRLMRTAREVNDDRPGQVVRRIVAAARSRPGEPVACFGLAFKANVDDLRESPAVEVVTGVAAALPDVPVLVVEPHVRTLPTALGAYDRVKLVGAPAALERAGVLALLVDHDEFAGIEPEHLAGAEVVDSRGAWRGVER